MKKQKANSRISVRPGGLVFGEPQAEEQWEFVLVLEALGFTQMGSGGDFVLVLALLPSRPCWISVVKIAPHYPR